MILRRLAAGLVWTLTFAPTVWAQAQSAPISDEEVVRLLQAGRANRLGGLTKTCAARKPSTQALIGLTGLYGVAVQALSSGSNVFDVVMTTTRGRIASTARQAAVDGRTLGLTDIPEADRVPGLHLTVSPRLPNASASGPVETPARVTDLKFVARREAGDVVFEPDSPLAHEPLVFRNAAASIDYTIGRSFVSGDRLRGFPAAEIVVLMLETEAGARVCELNGRDLRRFFQAAE